jgi:hypothetical protein
MWWSNKKSSTWSSILFLWFDFFHIFIANKCLYVLNLLMLTSLTKSLLSYSNRYQIDFCWTTTFFQQVRATPPSVVSVQNSRLHHSHRSDLWSLDNSVIYIHLILYLRNLLDFEVYTFIFFMPYIIHLNHCWWHLPLLHVFYPPTDYVAVEI